MERPVESEPAEAADAADVAGVADGGAPAMARRLLDAEPLRAPALTAALGRLDLPRAGRGLDVGCGLGLQALLAASLLQADVYGIDRDPALLAAGIGHIARRPHAARVHLACGDAIRLPFPSATFDWVWSVDCAGYPAGDLAPSLREMARVCRPGGRVAVAGWTAQRVLPGYPLLEARLDALCSAYAPYLAAVPPAHHFSRAAAVFHAVGLVDVRTFTVVHDVCAPLEPAVRHALSSLLDMLWLRPDSSAGQGAWVELATLRGEADDVLDAAGYHAWFSYTVVTATIPTAGPV